LVPSISLADVQAQPIEWLWPGRVSLGTITVLAGDPGLGKSLLSLQLAAGLSNGKLDAGKPGNTVLLGAEDSLAFTVKPRLEAAGADLTRIHAPQPEVGGLDRRLLFPTDAAQLQALVEEHTARLVVIDPLSAHLSAKVNSWKDQEVRTALAAVHAVAEQTRAAVLIVAHLNKGQSDDPLQRLGGSIGIPAAARSVLLLGRDPDDPEGESGSRRVLAQVKTNLGDPSASLLYEIRPAATAENKTATIQQIGRSPYGGRDLLAQQPARARGWKRERARELLRQQLSTGAKTVTELQQLADEDGISAETLKRAANELGIGSNKAGYDKGWIWTLPDQPNDEQSPAA
jgi:archaellum biogenesis ATPase FlaH